MASESGQFFWMAVRPGFILVLFLAEVIRNWSGSWGLTLRQLLLNLESPDVRPRVQSFLH